MRAEGGREVLQGALRFGPPLVAALDALGQNVSREP